MRRAAPILLLLVVAQAFAAEPPLDLIQRAYSPYMAASDPLAFPMKVRSIATDPYTFWRGSKDLFFNWCRTNTPDWLADKPAFLPNHGDLHLGNIGTYVPAGQWGKLAFGMVDFDDSAVLPFQLELLQGLITLELTARQNKIILDEPTMAKLVQTLLEAYRISVNSQRNATSLLLDAEDPTVTRLLKRISRSYQEELDDYTLDNHFRQVIRSEKGKLKEVLRPAMARADEFAAGIESAIVNEPDLRPLFRFTDAKSIRSAIRDAVQRTRLGSSGSQGLKKYFVLMQKPLKGIDHDVILYLKQEIPSAAEREAVIEPVRISPGRRAKQDMDRLTDPLPYMNSWCEIGSESYWVTLKEPWSNELDPDEITTLDELLHAAKIWGTVAGATHRERGRFEIILPRLTPALATQLRQRSAAFIPILNSDFAEFGTNPEIGQYLQQVNQFLDSLSLTQP